MEREKLRRTGLILFSFLAAIVPSALAYEMGLLKTKAFSVLITGALALLIWRLVSKEHIHIAARVLFSLLAGAGAFAAPIWVRTIVFDTYFVDLDQGPMAVLAIVMLSAALFVGFLSWRVTSQAVTKSKRYDYRA